MDFTELERAAALYPASHVYRIGPAKYLIRENVWTNPREAIPRLKETLANDPYSGFLKAWIAAFERRIGK